MNQHIESVILQFDIPDGAWTAEPYGNGHINDTYLIAAGEKHFILQRVNGYVFPKPEDVIENIERVTDFLKEQIAQEGGDPERETLTLVKTQQGTHFAYDEQGNLWRMYLFIEDAVSRDLPDTPELFELCGEAFGKFQRQMGAFPADSLHETIHDFHNTPARYRQLQDAIARNEAGRLDEVQPEIAFCQQYEQEVRALVDALEQGEIPLRVTHNDTKLNNVLLDSKTGRGVCVIDLDTVMPGLTAYDFGDAIRTGANTAEEDERDLSRVQFSLPMFEAFTRGFLKEAGQTLTARDGFAEKGFAQDDALDAMIQRFYAVHRKRFDNYFQKRRPTHTIFSKQAMARFAKTGRQSDHFFAMRPFTREERVAVLTHLKAQNEQNPYFSIYFFKPEYHQPRTEICLYEGKGTMLTKADTDYDFSGMHAEALITQPEFSRKYKEFFLKDLLESKVLSPKETLAAFDELIEIAKDA